MNDDKFGDENEAINQIYKIKDLDINIAVCWDDYCLYKVS